MKVSDFTNLPAIPQNVKVSEKMADNVRSRAAFCGASQGPNVAKLFLPPFPET